MEIVPRGSRALASAGIVLVAGGAAHVLVWALFGGDWEGPVSWRKPILFGFSAGLTCLSFAWIWSWLPVLASGGGRVLGRLTAAALLVEVALIDVQCWRGVPSHFNHATALDGAIADAMNLLIAFVTLVTLWLTACFFRGRPGRDGAAMPPDLLLAARAGLVMLSWSCILGFWATDHGERRLAAGLAPEIHGAAGVTKFAHGAVIHAIQWLPASSWLASRRGLPLATRSGIVRLGVAASGALALASFVQVLLGRARFDVVPFTLALFVVAAGCGIGAVALLFRPPPAK